MYGSRQGSRTPVNVEAKCQIFLEAPFICHNINTNLNKNFQSQVITLSNRYFYFFKFLQEVV